MIRPAHSQEYKTWTDEKDQENWARTKTEIENKVKGKMEVRNCHREDVLTEAQRKDAKEKGGVEFAVFSDTYSSKASAEGEVELYNLNGRIQQEEASMLLTQAINELGKMMWNIEAATAYLSKHANSLNHLIAQIATAPPIVNGGQAIIWFTGLSMTENVASQSPISTIQLGEIDEDALADKLQILCRIAEKKFGTENYCIALGTTAQDIGNVPGRLNEIFRKIIEREELEKSYRVHVKALSSIEFWENTEKGTLQLTSHTIAMKETEKKGTPP